MRDGERSIAEFLELGDMGLDLGYWRQAEGYFDAVLERAPGHPRALLGKAKACRDSQEALPLVRQVLGVRPASREARRLHKALEERLEASRELRDEREGLSPDTASERLERSPQATFTRNVSRVVTGLFAAGMDRETGRKLIAGYVIANLIVGALILATLYPRPLGLFDGQVPMETLQRLSDDETAAVKVASPSPSTTSDLLRQAERATALIIVPDPIFQDISRGSGSVIASEGLVITNYHVMTKEAGGILANREGLAFVGLTEDVHKSPSMWYIACLTAWDKKRDLAVLRIRWDSAGKSVAGQSFPCVPLGNSDHLDLGQTLMGLGYPSLGGDTLTLTRGSMAGFSSRDGLHLGKTDSELLPGSSGGAVLDATGRLVGVITAAHTDQRTQGRLSYFVLLSEARQVLKEAQNAPCPTRQIGWMVDVFDALVE